MFDRETARAEIEAMVHRETRAWNAKDAAALCDLFHPDMVWPWPPTQKDHDPVSWIFVMGRFNRERWQRSWQQHVFDVHELVHNRRTIQSITVTEEGDGGFAVVDIDTLWRHRDGHDNHWYGRVSKGYTRLGSGEWKLIMHTGALTYER